VGKTKEKEEKREDFEGFLGNRKGHLNRDLIIFMIWVFLSKQN